MQLSRARRNVQRELQPRFDVLPWRGRLAGRRWRALRRALALLLILLAGWSATRPPPAETGVRVVVATQDLTLGTLLSSADVAGVIRGSPPDGALSDVSEAVGARISAPVRRGEVLTDVRLVDPGGPDPGPGRVALVVHPVDPGLAGLLQPGMTVSVVALTAAGTATTLADAAIVLSLLDAPTAAGNAPLLLSVGEGDADGVSAASLTGDVSVRLSG